MTNTSELPTETVAPPAWSANHPRTPQEALEMVFKFTEADLRSNHLRTLTDAQRQRMLAKHQDDVSLTRSALLVLTVIGLLGSTGAAIQEGIPLVEMWGAVLFGMTVFAVLAYLILKYSRKRLERTIRASVVEHASGLIRLTVEEHKPRTHYFWVGPVKFEVSQYEYFLLGRVPLAGRQATVYYTTPWQYVLSVHLQT